MGEKLIALLTPIAHFFQKGTGSMSAMLGGVAPFWIVVGVIAIALIVAIFSLDKPKALSFILLIYAVGFVLTLLPPITKWLDRTLPAQELRYSLIALGALPIIALIVLKYKKRR